MKAVVCGSLAIAAISLFAAASKTEQKDPTALAVGKGLKWLVAVQGQMFHGHEGVIGLL